jgi:hypothetical protein
MFPISQPSAVFNLSESDICYARVMEIYPRDTIQTFRPREGVHLCVSSWLVRNRSDPSFPVQEVWEKSWSAIRSSGVQESRLRIIDFAAFQDIHPSIALPSLSPRAGSSASF